MNERVNAAAGQIDYALGVGASVEAIARGALQASDEVMFSEVSIERAVPYVDSFLIRRGYQPRGDESRALISYVMRAMKGAGDE